MVIQGGEGGTNNLLRRLANSQFHSYTTALTITIAVGCFLLLLNILIFAGIYYQREKRASDTKRKEEFFETEIPMSPNLKSHSRKGSLQSLPPGFHFHHHHFHQQPRTGSFVELSFDGPGSEKRPTKEYCDVELQVSMSEESKFSIIIYNTSLFYILYFTLNASFTTTLINFK